MSDKDDILDAIAAQGTTLREEMRNNQTEVMARIDEVKKLVDVIGTQTGQTELDVRAIKADVAQLRIDVAAYRMESNARLTVLEARP